jgi:Zn-dependent protease with chaperone function
MIKPAKNFFELQEEARRRTGLLVFLFSCAVGCIVVALYVVARVLLAIADEHPRVSFPGNLVWWDPPTFAGILLAVSLLIAVASFHKARKLSAGGSAVAEMLGARAISPDTADLAERRLRNVVEEMAIASGVPVPAVYVMDKENGINAFAAGHTPNDAAVIVTKGTLQHLGRDELQGVIAHEFSHILNGDMRLNIRLIGVLFGILLIGITGRGLLRGMSRSRSRDSGWALIVGLALLIIGYIGTLAGRIIQAAVSRQREFLADSSAVQFTRNPLGLAGALKKIGGLEVGATIHAHEAEQASHLFFGQGVRIRLFSGWLATHPPIAERVRRIDPNFDGEFPPESANAAAPLTDAEFTAPPVMAAAAETATFGDRTLIAARPASVVAHVGNPTAAHLDHAATLLGRIPPPLREAAQTPAGAASLLYALLFADDETVRQGQIGTLRGAKLEDMDLAAQLFPDVQALDAHLKLPLLDLATSALRQIGGDGRSRLLRQVEALVIGAGQLTLFEFCVQRTLARRRSPGPGRPGATAYKSFDAVSKDLAVLLAALANAGNPTDPDAAGRAFLAGVSRLPMAARKDVDIAQPDAPPSLAAIGSALDRLGFAAPNIKQATIDACAHCAFDGREMTVEDAELLRVISIALDCPLPPFLPAEMRDI